MNNKGFMMAEVVVVSSVIMIVLTSLYVSYNNLFSIYNQRINYYDVATLYELGAYRENNSLGGVSNEPKILSENKKIYYVNKKNVKEKKLNVDSINETFKDYLEYLSTSLDFVALENDGVTNILIMEKCNNENNKCKYAYLEVFD